MNYLVLVYEGRGEKRNENLHYFNTLEDAIEYAQFEADGFNKRGLEQGPDYGILFFQTLPNVKW